VSSRFVNPTGKTLRTAAALCAAATLSLPAFAATSDATSRAAIAKLQQESGGTAQVTIHPATGTARMITVPRPAPGTVGLKTVAKAAPRDMAATFLAQYGAAFGIKHSSEVEIQTVTTDEMGWSHVRYRQMYDGVPVYSAQLRVHFDAQGHVRAANGTFIPDLNVNSRPTITADKAASIARAKVGAAHEDKKADTLTANAPRLYVFREKLLQGVAGANRLVYEVTVGNRRDVREFVFVDAHSGRIVEQYSGIHQVLSRKAFDAQHGPEDPTPTFPDSPFWSEGDAFPTTGTCVEKAGQPPCNREADNAILGAGDTNNFFQRTFGRNSWDGAGAEMATVFDSGVSCPTAFWNGVVTTYCPFVTSDETAAHEWGHAYTERTHGLSQEFQAGALNESYSDIWGEVVDRINGRGTDSPGGPRTDGTCSRFQVFPPVVRVTSPAALGTFAGARATFGRILDARALNGTVALAQPVDACTALTNPAAVAGRIVLVDRGGCLFSQKALNAQIAGALAVIVADNQAADVAPQLLDVDTRVTIPGVGITQAAGIALKSALAGGTAVTVALQGNVPATTDNTYRWLFGEDDFDHGIRDMWNPVCLGSPGKVSDPQYDCGNGIAAIHTNAGVTNHAFALTVDGGHYNGQTIHGLGLTKAAHVYYRAMVVYQTPDTDFPAHADALKQSCSDLIGVNLRDVVSGQLSGQSLTAQDCAQFDKAAAAVEMRQPPTRCGFQPLLAQNPPALCPAGKTARNALFETFETNPVGWTVSHEAVEPADFTERDWTRVGNLPKDRPGSAFLAPDDIAPLCGPDQPNESAALFLTSPPIAVPAGAPLVSFTHLVDTEAPFEAGAPGFDGGNLTVSVNGGPFVVVPATAYTFNPYNREILPPGATANPLAGQTAFSGTDEGSTEGTWGDSRVDLTGLASAGDTVRLQWAFGNDECNDSNAFKGWYVDDVRLYSCAATPTISIRDARVDEGDHGRKAMKLKVRLSSSTDVPVTVGFETANGTAKSGSDYVRVSGSLTFAPGTVSRDVTVQVIGDNTDESNETFTVRLRDARNATIEDGSGKGTIVDDDGHHVASVEAALADAFVEDVNARVDGVSTFASRTRPTVSCGGRVCGAGEGCCNGRCRRIRQDVHCVPDGHGGSSE
jgi:Zn-dependent metalloprotease